MSESINRHVEAKDIKLGGKMYCDKERGGCGGAWWITPEAAAGHVGKTWPLCPLHTVELRFVPYNIEQEMAYAHSIGRPDIAHNIAVAAERIEAAEPPAPKKGWFKKLFTG